MGFEVRVTGGTELAAVRNKLRSVSDKGLGKQMSAGFTRALQPLKREIVAETRVMPSGYAPVLSRSMRFRQAVRSSGSTAEALLRVYAEGRRSRRMVPALNAGQLRHPLYGNRNHWFNQAVPPGFVDRPVSRLGPAVSREMKSVVNYVADQIGA